MFYFAEKLNDKFMQTILLKYDIISWDTDVNDKKLIRKLYQWIEDQKMKEIYDLFIYFPTKKQVLSGTGRRY